MNYYHIFAFAIFVLLSLLIPLNYPPPNCDNFDNQNACQGNQTENDQSWQNRNFQTPPRGSPLWKEAFQDYNILVGYAQVTYDGGRSSAEVKIKTRVNPKNSGASLKYYFNESSQSEDSLKVNSPSGVLKMKVEAYDNGEKIATLVLEDVDFIWNHPTVNQPDNFKQGQKGVIIEMFGWPYDDIASECEMIGKAGYLGVKVFPPQ